MLFIHSGKYPCDTNPVIYVSRLLIVGRYNKKALEIQNLPWCLSARAILNFHLRDYKCFPVGYISGTKLFRIGT